VRLITIHGRTRQQFYTGQADWAAIARIRAAVTIPVIANGDIRGPADAATALRLSGARGVMIGRGAQGAPWMPALIAHTLCGTPEPTVPSGPALVALVQGHHAEMMHFHGRDLGLRVARKHLGWYMDRAATPAALRTAVLTAATPELVQALLPDALAGHRLERAA
jgi:tRNA-dihydrouridine synthase